MESASTKHEKQYLVINANLSTNKFLLGISVVINVKNALTSISGSCNSLSYSLKSSKNRFKRPLKVD